MREIIRLVIVLSVICGVAAGALTLARQTLSERIELQSDFYVRGPALERLFNRPAAELLVNKITYASDGRLYPIFYWKEGDDVAGLAIEAAGQGGYGGDIMIMIGVDLKAEKIIGIEIIEHKETPGVGSQVEKMSFRRQWSGLSVEQPVQLGQQIDAISGATYSSRAVVAGTNVVVDLMTSHRQDILAAIEQEKHQ
ncbi:MAG: FMN-binding protein [Candidatus Zixiibacteriota bacterium]